jgi:hypothetical protein
LPSTIGTAPPAAIAFQAVFQGPPWRPSAPGRCWGEALPPLGALAVLLVSAGMVLGVADAASGRVDPPHPRS